MATYDVVIAGGGHNALACGAVLARAGLSVVVAERNPWVGGGVITREVTLPGFKHDLYGSSHVWIHANEAFNEMKPELEQHGLKYIWAEDQITGHPNHDGPGIVVYKSIEKTVESISNYSINDAQRYREIYDEFVHIKDGFIKGMFSPPSPPSYLPAAMENSREGLRRLRSYNQSAKAFVKENFENPHVQAFILGWALAPQILPDQQGIGQTFYIMIPAIHYYGESIPEGGSMMLSKALASLIESRGGKIMTNASVKKFIIDSNKNCYGIILEDGTEIESKIAVLSSLDPQQTFLSLIGSEHLSEDLTRMARNFSFGSVSICRVHYALNEPPKYRNGSDMDKTAFQRIFGSVEDLDLQYREIRAGESPSNPFLWVACWTTKDPSRAPEGKHTLIMDTFVPNRLSNGNSWEEIGPEYVDQILLPKLQEYTFNMSENNILGKYIDTADSLARDNLSLVNGTTTGGERLLSQSGYLRPFPGYANYRSPIRNLYLTGPSCHPGGGISAMGTITAGVMLEDFGMKSKNN
ncbi:MAG: NAD(P)/FAD-dependent oxidoreductase [SAR324 cluster bacterium]|jgi:phytoene dehydrogenase-like protein|nr:FAD-dependent oxidoreductase [Deltaproteobacteria bacterium]MDP6090525.1 NAD(P)/FAD-dependent oxidoreductase [SAR324 cluster bacterium]MBP44746.1 FAD-dependent oxidoreductase [Deltaproteobacteria bacterium]MDP6245122.1 NAD(P)/FAD-dependent oxidoreductase [SAR324 cluster bacterium]MDP6462478.1 NAD(P)/FAD-dependent oxidoreductase [SAR324 cluster bacterium]|tara:strand:+ start:16359 stop:17930 length:1572 start_codon:yes stop_codon:yes gene_type:complete